MKAQRLLISTIAAASLFLAAPHHAAAQQHTSDSLAFAAADWGWQDIGGGAMAGYAQFRMFDKVESISVVKYPSRKFRTALVDAQCGDAGTTKGLAKLNDAKMAINGSYFNVRTLEHVTFFTHRHKVLAVTSKKELFRTNGLLGIRGRKVDIITCDTTAYDRYRRHYKSAIASGPILIENGMMIDYSSQTGSFYTVRHPRSVVGKDAEGNIYYIVIDGRFPGQGEGASIEETALIARFFGCTDAINFDGGGSSTVWTSATGVINHPFDNGKFDHEGLRTVPNILIAR